MNIKSIIIILRGVNLRIHLPQPCARHWSGILNTLHNVRAIILKNLTEMRKSRGNKIENKLTVPNQYSTNFIISAFYFNSECIN